MLNHPVTTLSYAADSHQTNHPHSHPFVAPCLDPFSPNVTSPPAKRSAGVAVCGDTTTRHLSLKIALSLSHALCQCNISSWLNNFSIVFHYFGIFYDSGLIMYMYLLHIYIKRFLTSLEQIVWKHIIHEFQINCCVSDIFVG